MGKWWCVDDDDDDDDGGGGCSASVRYTEPNHLLFTQKTKHSKSFLSGLFSGKEKFFVDDLGILQQTSALNKENKHWDGANIQTREMA